MTPEQLAEQRVDTFFLRWQYAKNPKQRRCFGQLLTRAIKDRNDLRSPERVAEIERERGLR